jgi:two-component system probable response regulator PhcQ
MLVDDEVNVVRALRRALSLELDPELEGCSLILEPFVSPREALLRAQHTAFDLVITDHQMPEMNGVELLVKLRALQPDAGRIILSGYASLEGMIAAINEARISRFIAKPWHDAELRAVVARELSLRRLMLENRRLADAVRLQQGMLSRQELALRRLEEESPGITKVNWGPDGSVLLDPDDE